MKCKICGAELRKDGDICKKCYNEYVKDEEVKNEAKSSKNILLRLYRKYVPLYQLTRYGDYYVLWIFIILSLLAQKQYLLTILSVVVGIILLCSALAYNKRKAIKTTCTFYNKRIIWKYDDKIKSLDYSELEDITYYQNFFQKRFDLADVQFRPIKGTYITNGFEVKNVPNFKENLEKMCNIVNSKRDS